jgi:hypothetical protein
MQLIPVRKLIPLRNEHGEIYKWQEEDILLSPLQIARVRIELDKVVIRLMNSEDIIIEDSVKAFGKKFNEATT